MNLVLTWLRISVLTWLVVRGSVSWAEEAAEPNRHTAIEDFNANFHKPPTIWLEDQPETCVLQLQLIQWGETGSDSQGLQLSVPVKPVFVTDVRWPGGASVVFAEGEYEKQVVLEFDVSEGASRTEADMHILIEAVDPSVRPRERLLKIPFNHDVRPPRHVVAYPIRDDAPAEFPPEDAIDFCDTSQENVYKFDRVAVFFTPAINLDPPLVGKEFLWQVDSSTGGRFMRGEARFDADDSALETSLPFAKPGSPGLFALVQDYTYSGASSGDFRLKTTPAVELTDTLFEFGGGVTFKPREDAKGDPTYWQDEGRFEVLDARLHFQGFVLEDVVDRRLDDARLSDGRITVKEETAQHRVTLSAEASWVWAHVKDGGREPRGAMQRVESRLVLEFPPELDPGGAEMGNVVVAAQLPTDMAALRQSAKGFDSEDEVRTFTFGVHPLVPTNGPPGGDVVGDDGPEPWGWLEVGRSSLKRGDPMNLFSQGIGGDKTRTVRIHRGTPGLRCGRPSRHFAWHLRDEQTLWVLPVSVVFTGIREAAWEYTPVFTVWGYAIYGAAPGVYTSRPKSADREALSRGSGEVVLGSRPGKRRLDPNDPDLAGFISAWVAVAEPPENALYAADLRYNEWGLKIGTAPTGHSATRTRPAAAAGQTACEFLWSTGQSLDSVDHCTLGEYVLARLENRSVADCLGRYWRVTETPGVRSDVGDVVSGSRDRGVLGDEAVDGLVEGTDRDTTAPPRVHRTVETLGPRSDPDGPEIDVLREFVRSGEREGALKKLLEITGGSTDGAADLVDTLLDENATERRFDENNRDLDEPPSGAPVDEDGVFLSGVGLDADFLRSGEVLLTPSNVPDPEELTLPPARERSADSARESERALADKLVAEVFEEQKRQVEEERAVVREETLRIPIPTRGGMTGVDVGAVTTVVVTVWDHGQPDGDRVYLAVGGRVLADDLTLTETKQSFNVTLHDVFTPITVIAHNEGSESPNTGTLEVSTGSETIPTDWQLETNEMGSTLIRRLP